MAASPHISIAAEKLFAIGPLTISNSLLLTWIAMAVLLVLGLVLRARLKPVGRPGGLQNIFEIVLETWHDLISGVTGDPKLTRRFFGMIVTIFLFVLINNWLGLLPGVGSFGPAHEVVATAAEHGAEAAAHVPAFTPLLRAGTADLSFTITLALIAVLTVQFQGVRELGLWGYFRRFFNFSHGPIMFFVGLLELLSEFVKIVSFSFRLFGNIFAGEVILAVMIFLAPFAIPMPFYAFEIFVGFIQAFVFAMLTLAFCKMATTDAH